MQLLQPLFNNKHFALQVGFSDTVLERGGQAQQKY